MSSQTGLGGRGAGEQGPFAQKGLRDRSCGRKAGAGDGVWQAPAAGGFLGRLLKRGLWGPGRRGWRPHRKRRGEGVALRARGEGGVLLAELSSPGGWPGESKTQTRVSWHGGSGSGCPQLSCLGLPTSSPVGTGDLLEVQLISRPRRPVPVEKMAVLEAGLCGPTDPFPSSAPTLKPPGIS